MSAIPPEIIKVEKSCKQIACDGGGSIDPALGHPTVYYSFDGREEVTCAYCGRLFTKKNRKVAKKSAA